MATLSEKSTVEAVSTLLLLLSFCIILCFKAIGLTKMRSQSVEITKSMLRDVHIFLTGLTLFLLVHLSLVGQQCGKQKSILTTQMVVITAVIHAIQPNLGHE